jgi:hypothetical protein
MKHLSTLKTSALCLLLASTGLLTACGSNDGASEVKMASYQITLTNLSNNQPLSPLSALLHDGNYQAWSIGSAASEGLELLAEGGDNSRFLTDYAEMLISYESGAAPVGPGSSDSIMIMGEISSDMQLTFASMLVNTNDAFTGLTGFDLAALEVGQESQYDLPIYDAGTEDNSELQGTIPGPADGGEGFNTARDDVDVVTRHPGVVSQDDGYSASVLDQSHRFDSPIARLVITRLQ